MKTGEQLNICRGKKKKKNRIPDYAVPDHAQKIYVQELQLWLDNGWLLPYLEDKLGPP